VFIDPIVAAIGLLQPEYVRTCEELAGVRDSGAFVEDARQVLLLVPARRTDRGSEVEQESTARQSRSRVRVEAVGRMRLSDPGGLLARPAVERSC
jgi:hypothetical protein